MASSLFSKSRKRSPLPLKLSSQAPSQPSSSHNASAIRTIHFSAIRLLLHWTPLAPLLQKKSQLMALLPSLLPLLIKSLKWTNPLKPHPTPASEVSMTNTNPSSQNHYHDPRLLSTPSRFTTWNANPWVFPPGSLQDLWLGQQAPLSSPTLHENHWLDHSLSLLWKKSLQHPAAAAESLLQHHPTNLFECPLEALQERFICTFHLSVESTCSLLCLCLYFIAMPSLLQEAFHRSNIPATCRILHGCQG